VRGSAQRGQRIAEKSHEAYEKQAQRCMLLICGQLGECPAWDVSICHSSSEAGDDSQISSRKHLIIQPPCLFHGGIAEATFSCR